MREETRYRVERSEHRLARTRHVHGLTLSVLQQAAYRLADSNDVLHESRLVVDQAASEPDRPVLPNDPPAKP